MSLAIEMRQARVGDVDAVVALERGIEGAPHWAEREYRAMVASGEDGGVRRRLVVAEREGGGLVGFAVGKIVGQDLAEIESVAVAVEGRRSGVGRALCEALVAWFREEGAETVELEVRAGNDGAIALYRRLGFRETGRRKAYYRGPVEDAVLMGMVLRRG